MQDLGQKMKMFDIDIKEDHENELRCLLESADPIYWKAIVIGIKLLQQDTGASLDQLFSGVYAVVMEMEDVMNRRLSHIRPEKIDFNSFDISVKEDK